jgi:hypothetical protein
VREFRQSWPFSGGSDVEQEVNDIARRQVPGNTAADHRLPWRTSCHLASTFHAPLAAWAPLRPCGKKRRDDQYEAGGEKA